MRFNILGGKNLLINSKMFYLLEIFLYFACTGLHVLYAADSGNAMLIPCIAWTLIAGVVFALNLWVVKNPIAKQIVVITISVLSIFFIGSWVHTLEFGVLIYLFICIMVAIVQKPILCIISMVESAVFMLCMYIFYEEILTQQRPISFYAIMCLICLLAMGTTTMLVVQHQRQLRIIEEQKQALLDLQKSKDDFFANMSHEIRTPMNAVVGMAELILRETDISDNVRENAVYIRNSGKNLLVIINDILDFSKLESEKMEIAKREYRPAELIQEIINIAKVRIADKPVRLFVDYDGNIPEVLIGDEVRIRQVIINLVGNAVKFTDEGYIFLTMKMEQVEDKPHLYFEVKDTGIGISGEDLGQLFESFAQFSAKRNYMTEGTGLGLPICKRLVDNMQGKLMVSSDLGIGSVFAFSIPQEVEEPARYLTLARPGNTYRVLFKIDESPSKAICMAYEQSLTKMIRSLGINGEIVTDNDEMNRKIVEILESEEASKYTHMIISENSYLNNPRIYEALSEEMNIFVVQKQKRAAFYGKNIQILQRPFYLLSVLSALDGIRLLANSGEGVNHDETFTAEQAKVLLVDDNDTNLFVLKGLMKPYKMQVELAKSAKEAYAYLEGGEYDLVFMDHMMPDIDGIEALGHIRRMCQEYCQTIPVIAVSANATSGAKNMFLNAGFQDFISKPVDVERLERVLKKYLPKEKQERVEKQKLITMPEISKKLNYCFTHIQSEVGLKYFKNSKKDYDFILNLYYTMGEKRRQELEEAYTTKNIKNYTIYIHGLKSTSLNIGAVELSQLAKELEQAGKDENWDFIENRHKEFMDLYAIILEEIRTSPDVERGDQG